MALQDLTPQLRTRLSRMERAVGWFVSLAVALLVFGFGYYLYNTADRKGWFKAKATYFTFTQRATGLRVGDPVKLMGLPAGRITELQPMDPEVPYNIFVKFELVDPFYGYMWTKGSYVRVTTADFLGGRELEVTKGTNGYPTYLFHPIQTLTLAEARTKGEKWKLGTDLYDQTETNLLVKALTPLTSETLNKAQAAGVQEFLAFNTLEERKKPTAVWNDKTGSYEIYTGRNNYWLMASESAAVTERLEELIGQVEAALPNILALTNDISRLLTNSTTLTSNLNILAVSAQPAVSNLAAVTAELDHPGALGEWLLPTNINSQLDATLGNANTMIVSANTNLVTVVDNLNKSLENLAGITGGLNQQVQANTNMLEVISKTIQDADDLVQGLKRHWLLRSAFKNKTAPKDKTPSPYQATNAVRSGSSLTPEEEQAQKLRSPKDRR
jgi:ABC-type transporter Mla subunit MlaD